MNDVTVFGPEDSAGIVSFAIDGVHPHDLARFWTRPMWRSAPGTIAPSL
jgi:selenocysteine lyase/cysteine desulfurase